MKFTSIYSQKPFYKFINSYTDEKTGERYYVTPDDQLLPSVTTILNKTYENNDIILWRERVGNEKADEIIKESRTIGTLVHKNIENYIKNGNFIEGDNFIRKLSREMSKTIINKSFYDIEEIWGIEIPLWYPGLYAGTADIIFFKKKCLYIGDIKTTKNRKKDEQILNYKLQTVAYALAHNKLYETEIKRTHIFMISRNLEIQQWEINDKEFSELKDLWIDILFKYYEKK